MIKNAFIGKTTQPTSKELAATLGATKQLWNDLVREITKECGITGEEWTSYSPKAGWSLRLKQKKRNIIYLSPCDGCFRVAFVLGDKAMKAAKGTDFPATTAKLITEAPRYPEGSAIRFEVRTRPDAEIVKKLARIKVSD